jgi:hypothetical protein
MLKFTISKRQSLPFEMVLMISQRAALSNVLPTRLGLTAHIAGSGEEDCDGTGAGLATRIGILLLYR